MTKEKFPLISLFALTSLAFSAILTELLPAAVLIEMAKDLQVPESSIGQLVSYYAIGTVLTAIPAAAMTSTISRKPLLLFVIAGFFISNLITAYSQNYLVTLILRIIAGGFGGLLWPLIAGYAYRLVRTENTGKAVAIVMAGSTLALCVGLPVGAFLNDLIGWRGTFEVLSYLELILIVWVAWKIPNLKGEKKSETNQISRVMLMPGVALVLLTTFIASLAIYVSYTYLSPILVANGINDNSGLALLLFGIGAIVGIFITGRFIDGHLRMILLLTMSLGVISLLFIGLAGHIHQILYTCIAFWGISFGGLPSLLQTATIGASRGANELASSMTVTVYNIGIFSGAFIGGLILDFKGPFALTWSSLLLLIIAIIFVIIGHKSAFPKLCATE